MHHLSAILIAACFVCLAHSDAVVAAPDFSRSQVIVTPESPPESSVVEFEIVLRNSGDADAEVVQVQIDWPAMGYLIDAAGLDGAEQDDSARRLAGRISLPAGGEHTIRLRVLAPRDSAGNSLSVSCQAAHYASGAQTVEHGQVTIDTRPRSDGLRVGPTRITPAGLVFLAWLLATVVFAVGLRWWVRIRLRAAALVSSAKQVSQPKFSPQGLAAAIMIPLGFWLYFAGLAWRDYQVLRVWTRTKGTVVGRRELVQSTSTPSSDKRPDDRRPEASETTTETPEFAVRYRIGDQEIISSGYDTGSSLHLGGRVLHEQEMREWVRGAEIPVWVNPADPTEVVVRPGFGGAYFFALFPVPVFWFGLVGWRRLRQSLHALTTRRTES